MTKFAVISTGGKQYLVKPDDTIIVDQIASKENSEVELQALALFDENGEGIELGDPALKTAVKAKLIGHVKGDKVRISRFKAKVRYRKVRGFRASLSKIKILA